METYDAEATQQDNARAVARSVSRVATWYARAGDRSLPLAERQIWAKAADELDAALKDGA